LTQNIKPELVPFGFSAVCGKCGSENIRTTWHPLPVRIIGAAEEDACARFFPDQIGEHLCRACRDCGFRWCEAVSQPDLDCQA
jgi:hypothetical protein